MAAMFREVAAYSGVDEKLPSKGNPQGIIVPSLTTNPGASTLVILEGGNGLTVQSTLPSQVHVYEFKTKQERADATRNATNPSDAMRRLEAGSWRIFRITGDKPVGFDKVTVEAKNKADQSEATLKVIVLLKKTVKVAIRPVQVRDGKQFVSLGNAADPDKLLQQMNAIWNTQANVYFELGSTDVAKIDGVGTQALIEAKKLPDGFLQERKKDKDSAALTFFLVYSVRDGGEPARGVTIPKERISLIGNDRIDSTMAHEAGHFLGSLSEKGDYSSDYGHPESDDQMLMHEQRKGTKIPYSAVPNFNYGYRSQP
jgi:hypothetical protein